MHAVGGAQPADLPFKVGPLHCIAALVIDETVPDIDIGDARLFGAPAIQVIEVAHIAG